MRFRTFSAATMKEAMDLVRETLGPDAIILATRAPKGGGVEVTAAADMPEPQDEPAAAAAPEAVAAIAPRRGAARGGSTVGWAQSGLADILAYHGVPQPLAGDLARLAASLDADDARNGLAAALEARFRFAPIHGAPAAMASPARPLMLIGPAGVGKSVTAAKLASRFVLAGQAVELLSTDTARAGALEQLGHFAELLDCPLIPVRDADELAAHLAVPARDGAIRIVDTAGINPLDTAELQAARRLAHAADGLVTLVLAGGGDPREAADMAEAFARIGARRLIVTRLDATRRLGGLLAAADAGGLAFAQVGITPYVARGLSPLDPFALARLLLEDPAAHPSFDALHEAAE